MDSVSTSTSNNTTVNKSSWYSRRKLFSTIEGYLYLAPTLIVLTVFVFIPVFSSFQLSTTRVAPFGNRTIDIGLENYERLFDRLVNVSQAEQLLLPAILVLVVGLLLITGFITLLRKDKVSEHNSLLKYFAAAVVTVYIFLSVQGALQVSLLFTVGTTIPGIFLSVILAIALSMPLRRFSWFHRLLIFVPIVISSAVTGVLFRWIYHPVVGYINYVLTTMGIDGPNWLTSADWALIAVMLAVIWRQLGFNVIIALAGLQNINSTFYEAAKVDGANLWHQIRHITIPLLSPTLFFLFVINTINSLQVFGEIDVLTQGGPGESTRTLLYDIYFLAFRGTPQRGIASAESFVLFVLIVLLSIVQFRVASRRVHYQ